MKRFNVYFSAALIFINKNQVMNWTFKRHVSFKLTVQSKQIKIKKRIKINLLFHVLFLVILLFSVHKIQDAIRSILSYNIRTTRSCTRALVQATTKGLFHIVLLLLNYGVNPNKIDAITGTGPLHEAVRYHEVNEGSRQERLKIVRSLALFGADPQLVNLKREVWEYFTS